ncbi:MULTISPECIES: hypothetical protein [unclassified Sulfurospirillum]|uniref:hypothetical protein n=1 Tax=unclassified Sulfurospirillum TaxID=2618290 RepID=UPI0005006DCE|nr:MULTISPECIES: hypothetical protein [unclassified Sulfurospirillum]KFL35362.1 hypothetical protein JU57_01050 [Sulfurospirillum sp. SCADC]
MSWSDAFTIAIIEKNPIKLGKLIAEMPKISDIQEAKHAQALIQEALHIMKNEQAQLHDSMEKLKKTRAFITSAAIIASHKKEYLG